VLVPERCVGTVIAEEEDERVLGHAEFVEMIEDVAERLVHSLDQGREACAEAGLPESL